MTDVGNSSHKVDRRVERTREALLRALVDLIVEQGYDRTTVQDVLDRANVGRSTFYEHFANKDDLLLGGWTLFQLELPDDDDPSNGAPPRLPSVVHVFGHCGENHALYRSFVASGVAERIFAVARDDLATSLERGFTRLAAAGRSLPAPPAQLAAFLAAGLVALLRQWLDTGMQESPREMDARFRHLARTGLG